MTDTPSSAQAAAGYGEAIAELEQILDRLERSDVDVDVLAEQVRRAAELIAFCREHLAPIKCPRSVDFIDAMPRLPTGKLYKKPLREKYWAGHRSRIV